MLDMKIENLRAAMAISDTSVAYRLLTDDEGRPRLPVGRTDELFVLHCGVNARTRRDQRQETGQHSIPEGVVGRLLRSVLRRQTGHGY